MKKLQEQTPGIVAVIATKDRFDLLSKRSIPSVINQTRLPDWLIVVDDSRSDKRAKNKGFIHSLIVPKCKVIYIENCRTSGASGSWNTAIDLLCDETENPRDYYFAVLDDDDAWAPNYLERSYEKAIKHQLDMVSADFRRIKSFSDEPLINKAPEKLSADDFLIGNPGIQGSNLFIRLEPLLTAGGFDEALPSTTDRDLCIRLADLGTVRYARISAALVDHYAVSDHARLSTRDSEAKLEGLSAFWRKYAGRMTVDQQEIFTKRATTLFGWKPPSLEDLRPIPPAIEYSTPSAQNPYSLYVGVITSDSSAIRTFLTELSTLIGCAGVKRLVVLVLDNGISPYELNYVVQDARRHQLEVAVIDQDQQRSDAALGSFGDLYKSRPAGQVGISQARTMLQSYLGEMLAMDAGSIGWILDDDILVDERAQTYLPWLPFFRDQGVDVLLGAVEGSSPNPSLNGLRVQLVDLIHNLHWLRGLNSTDILPDRSGENLELRTRFTDYYYDLSRIHTGHLELPHWLEPVDPNETVAQAYTRLLSGAVGILVGAPLTRPVITSIDSDPKKSARPSVNRGGNTFILNYKALIHTPNIILRHNGNEARRSDMIWAIVNRYYRRMDIQSVQFSVHHVGRVDAAPQFNLEKIQGEMIGSAIYAGLTEFLNNLEYHDLDFTSSETEKIRSFTRKSLLRRLRSLKQSFYRIDGLRKAIGQIARPGELEELLGHLEKMITQENFERIQKSSEGPLETELESFLKSIRPITDDYAYRKANTEFMKDQIKENTPKKSSHVRKKHHPSN